MPPFRLKQFFPKDPWFIHYSALVLNNSQLLISGTHVPKELRESYPDGPELRHQSDDNHLKIVDIKMGKVISDWRLSSGIYIGPFVQTDQGVLTWIEETRLPVDRKNPQTKIYVGLVDLGSRRVLWKNPKESFGVDDPILHIRNWVIYSGGQSKPVYAADISSGRILGQTTGMLASGRISADHDQLYLPIQVRDHDATLEVYRLPAMTKLWERKHVGSINVTPSGRLITVTWAEKHWLKITCLDRRGHNYWSRRVHTDNIDLAFHRDTVYADTEAGLQALTMSYGKRRWLAPGAGPNGYTSLSLIGNMVYVWNAIGLTAVRAHNGKLVWRRRYFGPIDLGEDSGYAIKVHGLLLLRGSHHCTVLEPIPK